ncbi:hypothetical protein TYRP_017020 [Tyrophagus putrescentiae]|nr:hypothetical protein TYRP_017020 [Tyrophagus putrescentiae]
MKFLSLLFLATIFTSGWAIFHKHEPEAIHLVIAKPYPVHIYRHVPVPVPVPVRVYPAPVYAPAPAYGGGGGGGYGGDDYYRK